MEENNLKIIYITRVGVDCDGLNIYHFLIDEDSEKTWAEKWEEIPACNCGDLQPSDDMYEYVAELKSDIKLDLAQDNCCFSMSDCKDHCIALASENLNDYEEYPENRIVIQFGELLHNVESRLMLRDLRIKFV